MWNIKGNDANELTKQKQTHRLRKQTYSCQGEGTVRESGMVMDTLLYLKWITNRDLLYNTGNSLLNVMWQPGWEGSLGENRYTYMYGRVPLLFT